MSHPSSERVLVVPAEELDRLGRFQGFDGEAERYLTALLVPELMSYRARSEVEDDPGFKQIIPYVILRSAGSVFCYTRGKSQGEARLHRKRSLGVGGHVAEADADGRCSREAYEIAMRRELEEEVEVLAPGTMRLVGLINDDSTPVGSVHLGVVHVLDLESPRVHAREEGLAEAEFVAIDDLDSGEDEFETWSRICIDAYLRPRVS
ncbi:NUDIX domain-containing protein [Aquisphaera insulae]|uniref:NUDIX domain-containing protein n=1 Tax=Aquisphaera insulae TaxID=2712864 RepID=UPI0013EA472F|nr:NUDIX domain-containing protein [Aquisphaera insulae]